MEKNQHVRRFAEQLDLAGPLPHIETNGQNYATVEGCNGIVEYDGCVVKINCKNALVTFRGCDLSIENLSLGRISVTGKILCIEFE